MKRDNPPHQPTLPHTARKQETKDRDASRNHLHAATNPQTPAVIQARANATSNVPTGKTKAKEPDKNKVSPAAPEPSSVPPGMKTLDALPAKQFLDGQARTQQTDESATLATDTPPAPQLPKQQGQNINGLPAKVEMKDSAKNSAGSAPVPQTSEQEATSIDAPTVQAPEKQSTRSSGNALDALYSHLKERKKPAETDDLIFQPDDDSKSQAAAATQAQAPVQSTPSLQPSAVSDTHLQRALSQMENLQLNVLSVTATHAGPPAPDVQAPKESVTHKTEGNVSLASATAACQTQAAANLQNLAKDSGSTNSAGSAQDNGNTPPPTATAAGSSSDSARHDSSGQYSPAGHSPVSLTSGSGNGSLTSSFNSAGASSTTAVSASASNPISGQIAPTNSTPGGAPASVQTATSHAAAADRLTTTAENLNPRGDIVNAASMLQVQGKTEMRVALQTDNLGPVELHAVLEAGHLGASIAVVNHDAHTLLTNNLPALQQALTDQNLRLDHLSVLNTPMGSGTNTGNGGGYHPGGNTQSRPNTSRWSFPRSTRIAPGSKKSQVAEGLRGRLSVRA